MSNGRMLQIQGLEFETPFFLAPMAGFTDKVYRMLCAEMGASMVYTEMVSAKGLCYGDRKTPKLLDMEGETVPVAVQIFGSEPDIMARATSMLNELPNVILDVNMGCPVPKIVKNGEGSALLRDPELIYRIIKAMTAETNKPVSAKIRIGIQGCSENAAVEAAQAIEAGGGSVVAVHGRSREQYYSGEADLEQIAKVKEAVSIPVIGNGDVCSYKDAKNMFDKTGCDFIMVGRASLGNPWIFRELRQAYLKEQEGINLTNTDAESSDYIDASYARLQEEVSVEDIKSMIVRHMLELCEYKGEYVAVREMRKFTAKYLKGIKGSSAVRAKINSVDTKEQFCSIIEELI